MSTPEQRKQRIVSSEFTDKGRIVIVSQLPMQQPVIEGLNAEWRLNDRRDTLRLWRLDAKQDTAHLVISDPSGIQDTLKLRYKRKGGRRKMVGKLEEKTPLLTTRCDGNKAFYDDLRLAFTNPIVKVADTVEAVVMLLKDSTVSRYTIVVDSTGLGARIAASLVSGEKYHLTIAAHLFTDLYGDDNDSLAFDLTPKDYGTLSLRLDNRMPCPLVIEVLDTKDTVVQKLSTLNSQLSTLRFHHLPAGDYRLRAVVDCDSNGRWTPGDYTLDRQPEEWLLFEKTLTLREKWVMEEEWRVENKIRKLEGGLLAPLPLKKR
jgi:hypothetical protein